MATGSSHLRGEQDRPNERRTTSLRPWRKNILSKPSKTLDSQPSENSWMMKDSFPDWSCLRLQWLPRQWVAALQMYTWTSQLLHLTLWNPSKPQLEKSPKAADLTHLCLILSSLFSLKWRRLPDAKQPTNRSLHFQGLENRLNWKKRTVGRNDHFYPHKNLFFSEDHL